MNDEIKEINIKIPGQILDYVDTKEHLLELYNYITNLQQENEVLENEKDMFYKVSQERLNKWLSLNDENNKLVEIIKDYKSRIEKAVEYIKEDMYSEPNELYGLIDGEHLLNILNGKEEKKK